jgi:hypothetical protein
MHAASRTGAMIAASLMLSWPLQPAGAQTRLSKVPLSALTAQGFDVKAAIGNQVGVIQTLVLQKGEQVYRCSGKDLSIEPLAFECWQVK